MKGILLISNVGPKSMDRSKHKNKPEPINRPEPMNRPEPINRPKNMLSVRSLFKSPMLLLLQ